MERLGRSQPIGEPLPVRRATLKDPTPHELYVALRCPADYSRDAEYRYGWAEHSSWNWRGLDEFLTC